MKKILNFLFAIAFVAQVEQIYVGDQNKIFMQIAVVYAGPDVSAPGNVLRRSMPVDVTGASNLTLLGTAVAAEVRRQAAFDGLTIPANSVWSPTYGQL